MKSPDIFPSKDVRAFFCAHLPASSSSASKSMPDKTAKNYRTAGRSLNKSSGKHPGFRILAAVYF